MFFPSYFRLASIFTPKNLVYSTIDIISPSMIKFLDTVRLARLFRNMGEGRQVSEGVVTYATVKEGNL